MAKRGEGYLPSGRTEGYYDERGYHAGPAPKEVLRKLYPNLYPKGEK